MADVFTTQDENRQTAKRYLARYAALNRLHRSLINLMTDTEDRLAHVTAKWNDTGGWSRTVNDTMLEQIGVIDEAAERLRRLDDQVCVALDEVVDVISDVIDRDPEAGETLVLRYLPTGATLRFDDIAERMAYSPDWVRHLHGRGLDVAFEIMEARGKRNTKKHVDP